MKNYFISMFRYNDWANEQILNSFKHLDPVPEKCLLLFSHIIAAQDVWYERLSGSHDWNIQIWDVYSFQECTVLASQSTQQWMKLLRKLKQKDFDKLIKYKNSKGNNYESTVRDVLAHAVNHSTYHRAQISQLLRQNNIEPPITDYIFYTMI